MANLVEAAMEMGFLDVYLIAKNWRQMPISQWDVKATGTRQPLAVVEEIEGGLFRVETVLGEVVVCDGLYQARDRVAELFSIPISKKLN